MSRPRYKELLSDEYKDRDEQLQWIRGAVNGNAKFRNSEPPYSEEEELARKIMQMHTSIAKLEAEIDIRKDQLREAKNILIDKRLHIDSLYEEGYKLQQRIAELEAAQRWIPVSERLPEVGEEVFVCDESGHRRVDWLVCKPIDGIGETLFYSAAYIDGVGEALFYSAAYDDDPPTHWMPLPKLPEVQE